MVKLLKNKRWRYLRGIFITYFFTPTQSFRFKITSIDHNLRNFWSNSRFLWNFHNSADIFAHFQRFGGIQVLFGPNQDFLLRFQIAGLFRPAGTLNNLRIFFFAHWLELVEFMNTLVPKRKRYEKKKNFFFIQLLKISHTFWIVSKSRNSGDIVFYIGVFCFE